MQKLALTVVAATALAGAGALTLPSLASAQSAAPPAPPPAATMPMPHAHPSHGPMHGAGHWMEGGWARHALFERLHTWGLFHRPADLGLSPADVQTIAEGILLRHGQHEWKVGDVVPNADHTVSFAFTTAHGDVVARFSMDTRTGRITRTD